MDGRRWIVLNTYISHFIIFFLKKKTYRNITEVNIVGIENPSPGEKKKKLGMNVSFGNIII